MIQLGAPRDIASRNETCSSTCMAEKTGSWPDRPCLVPRRVWHDDRCCSVGPLRLSSKVCARHTCDGGNEQTDTPTLIDTQGTRGTSPLVLSMHLSGTNVLQNVGRPGCLVTHDQFTAKSNSNLRLASRGAQLELERLCAFGNGPSG